MTRLAPYPLEAVATGSTVTLTLPSNVMSVRQEWRIPQISVSCNSANIPTAAIYVNGNLWAATSNGNADTASGTPELYIGQADKLQIQWVGVNVGDDVKATIFYELASDAVQ